MTNDARVESLHEWNRLAQEGAENAMVSSMFEASSKAIEPMERFTTWLLVAAAAVASFLLGNADKLLPIIGNLGFLLCGLLLAISCLFGLLSKIFALLGNVQLESANAVKHTFPVFFAQHDETESKIQARAEELGVTIESGIRMDRVIREFIAPLPWWARWAVSRNLRKNSGNPQIAYIPRIRNLNRQGVCAFLQAISFLLFLVTGFAYAAAV